MYESLPTLGLVVGSYGALRELSRGVGVSVEALAIQAAGTSVIESAEGSQTLFGGRAAAISSVWEIATDCAENGWDGGSGAGIDLMAAMRAELFLRALPDGVSLPEAAPEPDGAISLDWMFASDRILSVSIGNTLRLAFAWKDGSSHGHGVEFFDGVRVPARIVDGVKKLAGAPNAFLGLS